MILLFFGRVYRYCLNLSCNFFVICMDIFFSLNNNNKKGKFQVVAFCLENIYAFWFSLPNLVSEIIRCNCYIQNFIEKKPKKQQIDSFAIIGYWFTFSKSKIFLPFSSALFQYLMGVRGGRTVLSSLWEKTILKRTEKMLWRFNKEYTNWD